MSLSSHTAPKIYFENLKKKKQKQTHSLTLHTHIPSSQKPHGPHQKAKAKNQSELSTHTKVIFDLRFTNLYTLSYEGTKGGRKRKKRRGKENHESLVRPRKIRPCLPACLHASRYRSTSALQHFSCAVLWEASAEVTLPSSAAQVANHIFWNQRSRSARTVN